jgi:hypothetical protein
MGAGPLETQRGQRVHRLIDRGDPLLQRVEQIVWLNLALAQQLDLFPPISRRPWPS